MLNSIILTSNADIPYKSFDESMFITKNHKKSSDYVLLEKIYEKNNPKALGNKKRNTIPKIIHQIWLGPNQIPAKHQENSREWRALHPDWEYKLWTEKDIENWDFPSKDLFDKSSSYQEKSNLLRYEILIKYGGLYLDFDYKPFKNFDEIHSKYDFYGTTEPIAENNNITVSDALVASVPNHEIFTEALKHIRSHWESKEAEFRQLTKEGIKDIKDEGFRQLAKKGLRKKRSLIHLGVRRCMAPFGESVIKNIDSENAIIFPTSYTGILIRNPVRTELRNIFGIQAKHKTIHKETMAAQRRGESVMANLLNIKINEPWYEKTLRKIGLD